MAAGYESFPVFESTSWKGPMEQHMDRLRRNIERLDQVTIRPGQLLDAHGPWIIERPTTQLKDIVIPFGFPEWFATINYVVEEPCDYPVYPEDVDI